MYFIRLYRATLLKSDVLFNFIKSGIVNKGILLFLCAEVCNITNTKDRHKRYFIYNKERQISQYVDVTSFVLDGSTKSMFAELDI